MERIVLKFGGTSLGNTEKILSVARIIQQKHKSSIEIIVVVSAMSGVTNDLVEQSKKISSDFEKAELDALLSSGEQVSSALLAAAIVKLGIKSRSWLSWQIPILTEGNFGSSRILHINLTTSMFRISQLPPMLYRLPDVHSNRIFVNARA